MCYNIKHEHNYYKFDGSVEVFGPLVCIAPLHCTTKPMLCLWCCFVFLFMPELSMLSVCPSVTLALWLNGTSYRKSIIQLNSPMCWLLWAKKNRGPIPRGTLWNLGSSRGVCFSPAVPFLNGHNSATHCPIDSVFGSMPFLVNFKWPYIWCSAAWTSPS